MSAAAVGPVKAMLLQLDAGKLKSELGAALAPGQFKLESIRGFLKAFAERNGIPL